MEQHRLLPALGLALTVVALLRCATGQADSTPIENAKLDAGTSDASKDGEAAGAGGGAAGSGGSGVAGSGGSGSAGKAGSGAAGKAGSGAAGSAGSTALCTATWSGVAACDACFQIKCVNECGQCGPGSDCDELILCANDCGTNTACVTSCKAAHPDGVAVINLMGNCVDAKCAVQCADTSTDPCGDCQTAYCSGEIAKCEALAACIAINDCIGGCSTQACYDACGAANPTGINAFNAASDCVTIYCATECQQ